MRAEPVPYPRFPQVPFVCCVSNSPYVGTAGFRELLLRMAKTAAVNEEENNRDQDINDDNDMRDEGSEDSAA